MTEQPSTANPAAQPVLRRRVSTHASAVARMRDTLAAPDHDLPVRSLARQSDDPSVALLDTWAVVCDVVAFYSERIATEGFLRTATRRESVRELARTLGYELRPGVSAQVDLAFTAEQAVGAPPVVDVPAGTAVSSIPAAGQVPQTFETTDDLEVRAAWNRIPVHDATPQTFGYDRDHLWLRNPVSIKAGDEILVVGSERVAYGAWPPSRPRPAGTEDDDERWEFRTVVDVDTSRDGWTRIALDNPLGYTKNRPLLAAHDVSVHVFTASARLFGANAPDPALLADEDGPPPGAAVVGRKMQWTGYEVTDPDEPTVIEIDGEHAGLLPGTWVVLEQPGVTEAYLVERVTSDGAAKFAVTGPMTRVRLDLADGLTDFSRRRATAHIGSRLLPAADEPDDTALTGAEVLVAALDPPLPPGRRVVISGLSADTGTPSAETAVVASCEPDGALTRIRLREALTGHYRRAGLHVLGNVAAATHGESVEQVLGSGGTKFLGLTPRRAPLTHLRTTTAQGFAPALTVRVDGVAWKQVAGLAEAGPQDRVYSLEYREDATARIVFGDGEHGAVPPAGQENITAQYRVGIGEEGLLDPGQLSMMARRPLGIREVSNPAAPLDAAPAETLEQARVNAPLRVRTLDRAVSVTDYADFARGYAGIGPARADLVWDGRMQRVVVSVLGSGASEVSADLLADLRTAIDDARDRRARIDVRHGTATWFAVRVEMAHDPDHERDVVLAAVHTALDAAFAAPVRSFAVPVTAAQVLVTIKAVPGVLACTMPRLLPVAAVPDPPATAAVPPDASAVDPVPARPGRWDEQVVAAELLGLAAGAVEIAEMIQGGAR